MNAQEAKELSSKNENDTILEPIMQTIHNMVKDACEKGKYNIRMPNLDNHIEHKIKDLLMYEGYKFQSYSGDIRGQRECDWLEMSWK